MEKILILGSSGYVGSHLLRRLKEVGKEAVGTHFKNPVPGTLFFDLASSDLPKGDFSYVVFASASYKKVDDFRKNRKACQKADLEGTKRIIEQCLERKIVPLYLSTDHVFDGQKGNYSESDKTHGLNFYGIVKAEIETYFRPVRQPWAVIRNGRVFGTETNDGTVLTDALQKLRNENGSRKFSADQIFTPVHIEDLCGAIQFVIEKDYRGILNVASCTPTTHYEIASKVNDFFGLQREISKCSIDDFQLLEKRPKKIDLDIRRYKEFTGFEERSIESLLEMIN